VQVSYFLATVEGALASTIITGVSARVPNTPDELVPFFEGLTNDGGKGRFNKWVRHEYEFTAQTDSGGSLYVLIGVWATFEVGYVYYLDAIRASFTRRQAGATEPIIDSVDFNGAKKLRINGSEFGPSPRVIIDNVDRSDFVTLTSNNLIRVKGAESDLFAFRPLAGPQLGYHTVQVLDDTTAAASQPFHLTLPN
jgi:hypothetical protein